MEISGVFEVGKQTFPPSDDAVRFDMADDGATLLYQMSKPSKREVKSFQSTAEFAFVMIQGVIYFLSRFGYLDWNDAPYHRALSKKLTRTMTITDGSGLALRCLLVDAESGILLHQRLIGLGTDFSIALVDEVERQPSLLPADYDAKINAAYALYSSDQMAGMAKYKFRAER